MQKHILCITVAVFEPAEEFDDLRVNSMHTDVENRFLTRLPNRLIELLLRFAHYLLDSARMNTPVRDQFLQGQPGDFSANWIVPGNYDGLRRVVDNQVDTRRRFESTNIATFATDNLSF